MPSKNKDIDGANESVKKVNEVEKNKNAKVDEQTSEKIKINYKMAQNIISCNRNNIRLEAVYNIARSLNISIDDLLFKNIFKN